MLVSLQFSRALRESSALTYTSSCPHSHAHAHTHTPTGAGISTLAYPLNTARIHMQQRVGGPRLSIGAALRECVAERGGSVLALYRGVWLNASTACIPSPLDFTRIFHQF